MQFNAQRLWVGIGDEDRLFALRLQKSQKLGSARPKTDQMFYFCFQCLNIHADLRAPVIEAIPVEAAMQRARQICQILPRTCEVAGMMRRITRWQILEPEIIVESQIEQSAVHVEQHGINS